MNILVIGGGGREHAISLALSQSELCETLHMAPGNPAMTEFGTCHKIGIEDSDALFSLAQDLAPDLVVIGPEAPLVDGLADRLTEAGIATFGPSAAAAQLEGSKDFARQIMAAHDIPQPDFKTFTNAEEALSHALSLNGYCVIKADGLAAGKGVVVSDTMDEAGKAIIQMLDGQFGSASASILIEERISGPEISAFALIDGKQTVWLASAQDHKRAYDDDKGPNTGGMGAVSPSPLMTEALRNQIMDEIINPVAKAMDDAGTPYRGVLYAGLMLTQDGPKVIEFNCRFGDPEAEVIIPRIENDFLALIYDLIQGKLVRADMSDDAAVTVVLATKGYPGDYEKGSVISKLEEAGAADNVTIYHAGTAFDTGGRLVASGGRVLAVTALGDDIATARHDAYEAVDKIEWPEGFCRRDIAKSAS
ncbi:MAG: phosphoribosylamine--glycine ligase [Candidatus Puniceispirillaceae bacterium]